MSLDDFAPTGNRGRAPRPGEPVLLPAIAPGVTLWWSDLAHGADELARGAAWLSLAETDRAARFGTEALRRKYTAGRSTLRAVLGGVLGVEPAAVAIRRGARGRPELAGGPPALDFNISHTEGGAVIGIAHGLPTGRRIGVDVERQDRGLAADRLARKFLSPDEQAELAGLDADGRRSRFLRYWTCKEAMSKATGDGLIAPFAALTVDLDDPLRLVAGPPPYVPARWRLHAIAALSGYFATVALWHGDPGVTSAPRP